MARKNPFVELFLKPLNNPLLSAATVGNMERAWDAALDQVIALMDPRQYRSWRMTINRLKSTNQGTAMFTFGVMVKDKANQCGAVVSTESATLRLSPRFRRLNKLRAENAAWMARYKANHRNKTTTYTCLHCGEQVEIVRPSKSEVGRNGTFSTAKSCIGCGNLNFVHTYPTGKTVVTKM